MTPNEVAALRTDLLAFSKHMFHARKGSEFIENWHHRKLCEALERVVIGKSKRLIINIPPRYSKTELAVVNFIAWCMGNFPDSEFIHASYSQRLAANNTWNARALMEHEAYAEIFGKPALRRDSNAKDEYRTESGGVVYATGAGGTITGYGAGKLREDFGGAIIIDDPHKASEATSDTMRQNVIDWFGTTMESRLNSPYTPIIVIMQRLHEEDLAGWLLAGGNGEEWDHIDIPVLDEEDNPLWEFKHDRQKLADMEKANPYVFAGQYMQRPAPKGGGVFKDSWWQYYNVGEEPEMSYRTIYADTAMKTKEHNDYSVFQLWGESGGKVYLLDMLRGKWEAHDLVRIAREFFNRHKMGSGHLRSMRVEDKASGTGLIQTLRSEGVPIQGIPRDKDKYTRALDVVPQIATGNVYLPKQAPWLNELLSEATQFPNAKHDDTLDPLMDAISEMLISVPGGALFLPARMRR